MKKLSLLDKVLYIINSVAAVLLLLSYFLPFVSPKSIPFFAILSLFVPFLLLFNIAFFIYWLIKLKKQLLTSLLVLIVGWFALTPFYKLTAEKSTTKNELTIMSYNVRMFNYWKWKNENEVETKIKKLIQSNNPDIVAIQEYMLLPKYSINYPYKYIKKRYEKGRYSMAIYSKFPIINKGFLELGKSSSNGIIFTDILREKDTIRVYNLHLQSLNIKPEKENFGEENSEKLIQSLKYRFKLQAEQVDVFLAHEKQWKGKKVVCGDFNNTAYSWVYNQISKNKKDAFLEAGKGFGKTFDYWFPMRIDFILTDNLASVNQFKTFTEKYSDHYAIHATVIW